MSDLFGNPGYRFSLAKAHVMFFYKVCAKTDDNDYSIKDVQDEKREIKHIIKVQKKPWTLTIVCTTIMKLAVYIWFINLSSLKLALLTKL